MREFSEDLNRQKVAVEGGGSCIYCGSDGRPNGLRDEHMVPYSLGGNAVLLAASCQACERITSYLDGYLANATYKHVRVHGEIQSRSGHPRVLPALVSINGDERVLSLEPSKHPFFVHMPVWRPPGIMRGAQPSPDFGDVKAHVYWYVPPDILETIDLSDGDRAQIQDTTPMPNISTFARAIAKIAYCHAIYVFGLGGFRPLMLPDVILGRCPNTPFLVGSDLGHPDPPDPRLVSHLVQRSQFTTLRLRLITMRIRLFANTGTQDYGMPHYEVVVGSEGRTNWRPRPNLALPRTIAL